MKAIILEKTGDAKLLKIKEIDAPKKFKKDDVLVRHTAIGVNFFDICFRRGQYGLEKMPAILGQEACGVVEAVGSNVKEFKVGEKVAYATGGVGAYAQKRVINKVHLVAVPQNIDDVVVAASLMKGMMAHALLFRVFIAKRSKKILVHSAAGGVGQFLCQWAKAIGVEVIGTVGNQEKVHKALENGCKSVINREKGNFYEQLLKITENRGVGVVYDGIGKDTLINSLKSLWPMGICATYGESSGKTAALDIDYLTANSLYLTRPTLALYKANRVELALSAMEVFNLLGRGILKPTIKEYAFEDVVKAHQELESGKSVGSIVLKL